MGEKRETKRGRGGDVAVRMAAGDKRVCVFTCTVPVWGKQNVSVCNYR